MTTTATIQEQQQQQQENETIALTATALRLKRALGQGNAAEARALMERFEQQQQQQQNNDDENDENKNKTDWNTCFPSPWQQTCLHRVLRSARNAHDEPSSDWVRVFKFLMEQGGANVDALDKQGFTPLQRVVLSSLGRFPPRPTTTTRHDNDANNDNEPPYARLARLLLEHGADPNAGAAVATTDVGLDDCFSPPRCCCTTRRTDNVNITTLLHLAVLYGSVPLTKLLLKFGTVDMLDSIDGYGRTPLHVAAALKFGEPHYRRHTPLELKAELLELLSRHIAQWQQEAQPHNQTNADDTTPSRLIDFTDARGQTPLLLLVEKGQASMVELLLDHGANPRAANTKTGETPLHVAIVRAKQQQHTRNDGDDDDNALIPLLLSRGVAPSPEHVYEAAALESKGLGSSGDGLFHALAASSTAPAGDEPQQNNNTGALQWSLNTVRALLDHGAGVSVPVARYRYLSPRHVSRVRRRRKDGTYRPPPGKPKKNAVWCPQRGQWKQFLEWI